VFLHAGGREVAFSDISSIGRPSIIIDALLGYNVQGAPRYSLACAITTSELIVCVHHDLVSRWQV
jgi:NAD(P)H-hydrate repair Nnr-like enzyme with NAD(P)H-hydrate epimerase domain